MKKMNEEIAHLEALLFVAGDEGMSVSELKDVLELRSDQVVALVETLTEAYQSDDQSGLTIIETAERYQLVTKPELSSVVERYAQSPYQQTLSRPLIETLAIIAYKQPITRVEIEEIRGVQVAGNLQKLRLHHLIEEAGRLERPGRPLLYRTTDYFLDYFGLNALEELPQLEQEAVEPTNLFYERWSEDEGE